MLQEARSESPDHPVSPLILGQLARRQKQNQLAREYFAAASSLPMPESWPESHQQRFRVLLQSERFQLAQQLQDSELARDALSQWLKCDPGNRQLKKMYDDILARPCAVTCLCREFFAPGRRGCSVESVFSMYTVGDPESVSFATVAAIRAGIGIGRADDGDTPGESAVAGRVAETNTGDVRGSNSAFGARSPARKTR